MPVAQSSRLLVTLVILWLTSSGQPCRAQAPSPLEVDGKEYRATCRRARGGVCSYGFTLVARYENRTADSLYVSYCPPRHRTPRYSIPLVNDTTNDSGYDRAWRCVGHKSPIVIAPHATRVDTLEIEGPNVFDGHTMVPQGKLEGDFRLVYEVGTCSSDGAAACLLPLEERSSGAFHVVRER